MLATGLSRTLRENGDRVAILTKNELATTLSINLSTGTRAVMRYIDDAATIEKLVLEIDPSVRCILCVGWNQSDTSSVLIGTTKFACSNLMYDLTIDSVDSGSYEKLELWLESALADVFQTFCLDEPPSEAIVKRIWRFTSRLFATKAVQ